MVKARSIKSIMFGRNFYDQHHNGLSVDPFLSRIENDVAPILALIRRHSQLPALSPLDQRILALFVATQMFRTPKIRTTLEQLADGSFTRPDDDSATPTPDEFAQTYPSLSPTDVHFSFITEWSSAHAALYFTKLWAVLRTPPSCSLVIGDNPAWLRVQILHEDKNVELREGTIYLPLGPHLCLCFMPRHVADSLIANANQASRLGPMWLGQAAIDAAEVHLLNSAQAQQATRYVVVDAPDFAGLH